MRTSGQSSAVPAQIELPRRGRTPGDPCLFRQLHADLDGGVPGREVSDVLVAQVLGDDRHDLVLALAGAEGLTLGIQVDLALAGRSEERRVGQACVRTCCCRGLPYHLT